MARELILQAEPSDGMFLHQEWISGGDDEGDVSFSLICGAGLGTPFLAVRVEHAGTTVREIVDVRDALTSWVQAIVAEIDAAAD
jgi:hypothetical protein